MKKLLIALLLSTLAYSETYFGMAGSIGNDKEFNCRAKAYGLIGYNFDTDFSVEGRIGLSPRENIVEYDALLLYHTPYDTYVYGGYSRTTHYTYSYNSPILGLGYKLTEKLILEAIYKTKTDNLMGAVVVRF